MSFTASALVLAWLAIVLLALGLAGLLRQVNVLTRQVDSGAGPTGAARPGAGARGARTTRDLLGFRLPATEASRLLRGHPGVVVVFVAPGCSSCGQTLDLLAADPLVEGGELAVTVVSTGSCPPATGRPGWDCVPQGRELLDRLLVPATPYLVALDPEGTVRDALLPDPDVDLGAWLRQARGALPVVGSGGSANPSTQLEVDQ